MTIETSLSVVGQVTARELFAHPAVAAGTNDLTKRFDAEKVRKALAIKQWPPHRLTVRDA